MTYRKYYWQKTKEQVNICWILFWNGVVMNRGHHSKWTKGWFWSKQK